MRAGSRCFRCFLMTYWVAIILASAEIATSAVTASVTAMSFTDDQA